MKRFKNERYNTFLILYDVFEFFNYNKKLKRGG